MLLQEAEDSVTKAAQSFLACMQPAPGLKQNGPEVIWRNYRPLWDRGTGKVQSCPLTTPAGKSSLLCLPSSRETVEYKSVRELLVSGLSLIHSVFPLPHFHQHHFLWSEVLKTFSELISSGMMSTLGILSSFHLIGGWRSIVVGDPTLQGLLFCLLSLLPGYFLFLVLLARPTPN